MSSQKLEQRMSSSWASLGPARGRRQSCWNRLQGLPQISTGDIFRYNLKNQTELGVLAKSYMDQGSLVPDDVTIRMVEDRLQKPDCAKGAIMDGFPRTLARRRRSTRWLLLMVVSRWRR